MVRLQADNYRTTTPPRWTAIAPGKCGRGGLWQVPESESNAGGAPENKKARLALGFLHTLLAEWTGLEPATPGVTGRYSNQLNYHSVRLDSNAALPHFTLDPCCIPRIVEAAHYSEFRSASKR